MDDKESNSVLEYKRHEELIKSIKGLRSTLGLIALWCFFISIGTCSSQVIQISPKHNTIETQQVQHD